MSEYLCDIVLSEERRLAVLDAIVEIKKWNEENLRSEAVTGAELEYYR